MPSSLFPYSVPSRPLLPSFYLPAFLLSPLYFSPLLSAFLPLSLLFLLKEDWKQPVRCVYSSTPRQRKLTAQHIQKGVHPLLTLSLNSLTQLPILKVPRWIQNMKGTTGKCLLQLHRCHLMYEGREGQREEGIEGEREAEEREKEEMEGGSS